MVDCYTDFCFHFDAIFCNIPIIWSTMMSFDDQSLFHVPACAVYAQL